jgi:H(+)-transporting ATP synthase subunit D
MKRGERIAVTRQNLLRARRRISRVFKGAELLRRRREALARELLRLARPAVDARGAVMRESQQAYRSLLHALSLEGESGLRAYAWPPRPAWVELRHAQVWGVPVADIVKRSTIQRSLDARGTAPGAGPSVLEAADRFETLLSLLLDAAPREQLLRRLGDALSRTSRQVHALENSVAPRLEGQINWIRGSLEEREREEHERLKRFARNRARNAARNS